MTSTVPTFLDAKYLAANSNNNNSNSNYTAQMKESKLISIKLNESYRRIELSTDRKATWHYTKLLQKA